MNKTMILIIVLFIFISGCVTVETIDDDSVPEENTDQLTGNMVNQLESTTSGSANFNIEIDLPKTYQQISPGNELWFTTKLINLANQERIDVTLTYQILDKNGQLQYSKSETVAVETQASFVANLQAPPTLKSGLHYLKVILGSQFGQSEAETTFTVTKEESEPQVVIRFSLFDIQVIIPEDYKTVYPGEELLTSIKLINVGSGGRIDIFLSYWITDQEDKIILEEKETVAVETQNNFVRTFELPEDTPAGQYTFHAKLSYPGLELEPEYATMFTVAKKKLSSLVYGIIFGSLILVLGTILSFKFNVIRSRLESKLVKRKVEEMVKAKKK
ncbi:MAG: hypothetical protein KJ597_00990 [Nanoarchaeota archaeon]|nr:hypothetical protein [Nanoarchaeota archaeon]